MSDGATLIARERLRQLAGEGYTPEHDDDHGHGELVDAAVCYAKYTPGARPDLLWDWPWRSSEFKPDPEDPVHNLVRAGALIAAEIDRVQRFRAAEE